MVRETNDLLPKIRDEIAAAAIRYPGLFSNTRAMIIGVTSITPLSAVNDMLDSSQRYDSAETLTTEDKLRLLLKARIRDKVKPANDAEKQALDKLIQEVVLKLD